MIESLHENVISLCRSRDVHEAQAVSSLSMTFSHGYSVSVFGIKVQCAVDGTALGRAAKSTRTEGSTKTTPTIAPIQSHVD